MNTEEATYIGLISMSDIKKNRNFVGVGFSSYPSQSTPLQAHRILHRQQ